MPSSIKNLSRSKCLLFFALAVAGTGRAEDWLSTSLRLKYLSRLGYHLFTPVDLATHRHLLEVEEKVGLGRHLTLVAGGRAYVEGAFATNSRYTGPVQSRESHEVVPRDVYLQYKEGPWVIRLGNQQVVWGEAFGFFFADIVNPKDVRELGLGYGVGELEMNRIPVPMVNVKAIFSETSFQAVVIPKPFFNRVAALGSDFAFPFERYFPGVPVTVRDDRTLPLAWDNVEAGGRATALVGGIDLSAFALSYHDRMPSYSVTPSPGAVTLDASHPRLFSLGVTGTADLETLLLRVEGLYTWDRPFDAVLGNRYVAQTSDEITAVVGADYPGIEGWRLGLQVSESRAVEGLVGTLLPANRTLLSLHVGGSPWLDHAFDTILSYSPRDGSSLVQASYGIPLSSQVEIFAATDVLLGGPDSQFGRYRRASRAYAMLKAFLQ